MKTKEIYLICIIYTVLVFSVWVGVLKYQHTLGKMYSIRDNMYYIDQIKKASYVIEYLNDKIDTFELMVQSLNQELDNKEAYIAELESQNKLLKDLRSSKK